MPQTMRNNQCNRCSSGSGRPTGASTTSISGRVRYGVISPSRALAEISVESSSTSFQKGLRYFPSLNSTRDLFVHLGHRVVPSGKNIPHLKQVLLESSSSQVGFDPPPLSAPASTCAIHSLTNLAN